MLTIEKFNSWVSLYGHTLYKLAYRLAGKTWAEDVVQETFRSAWVNRNLYRDGNRDISWLITILRRRIADHHRSHKSLGILLSDVEEKRIPFSDGFSDEVQNALNQLAPEIREAFLLVAVGELAYQEAATILNVPIGTVLSRVSRARLRLRIFLQQHEKSLVG